MSSTPVVLKTRLPYHLRRTKTKYDAEKRRNLKKSLFPKCNTNIELLSVAVLNMHAVKSLLHFSKIYAIEIYIYARKTHPCTSYPAAKHPKHGKFAIIDIREKSGELFLLYDTDVDFSSLKSFANLDFFFCRNYNSLHRPGNRRFYRHGNSATFFSYACNDKKVKELFTLT